MRIAENKLKEACSKKGLTISALLEEAGVSRNAFYTLARKKNLLPHSITAIADTLDVDASSFLEFDPSPTDKARKLHKEVDRVSKEFEEVNPENVRHTLQLLDEKPIDRLRRALTRGQRFNFQ